MAGPITVTCPICRRAFPVPAEVVGVDETTNQVLVRMDRSDLYGHLRTCAATADPMPTEADQDAVPGTALERRQVHAHPVYRARVHKFLEQGNYVARGGSRACTMCGTTGAACLQQLEAGKRTACCAACGVGNTHPAPGEDKACSTWAAEQDAQD